MKSSQIIKILTSTVLIILMVLLFDLIINILLPENLKKKIGTTRNYSLKSEKFHHEIASNINLYEYWGKKKYNVVTNKYGMRVLDQNMKNLDITKDNIAFLGDSFVYGSGIDYKNHFINKLNSKKHNYLNLGFVSYSPSIYYQKLKFHLEENDLKFNKVFILIDHSDVQDEAIFYREDNKGNIVRKWQDDNEVSKKNKKYIIKNYFKQHSFIFKLYENLSAPNISNESSKCIMENYEKNYKNFIEIERFGYSYNKNILEKDWVNKGINKITNYLNKIYDLSKKNNFQMYIIYYPSALEVLENIMPNSSKHYLFLKKWTDENNIKLINTFDKFFSNKNGKKNYLNNFIECDVHWNNNGHSIIANEIAKYINE